MSEPSQAKTDTARAGLRNYVLVTGAYWADTVTDGATRMLVLFYFYNLGYTPLPSLRCSSSTKSSAF
jgi:hypothetical protein